MITYTHLNGMSVSLYNIVMKSDSSLCFSLQPSMPVVQRIVVYTKTAPPTQTMSVNVWMAILMNILTTAKVLYVPMYAQALSY